MTTENRDFKGVWISKEVWLDTRLSAIEKIILTEIDSLDSGERGCWASNKYIADFCQCSERTVSSAISKLIKLGYLYVQSFDGRQRELKSKFTKPIIIVEEGSKICEADLQDKNNLQNSLANNVMQGSKICEADLQNLQQSNTSNNTTNNIKDIIDYLNTVLQTNYKYKSANTQKHIKARLEEGFTFDDFKAVIDKKTEEWKDTEMQQYLRPETLFGNKFESYLNAPIRKPTTKNTSNNNNTGNIFLEIAEDEGVL